MHRATEIRALMSQMIVSNTRTLRNRVISTPLFLNTAYHNIHFGSSLPCGTVGMGTKYWPSCILVQSNEHPKFVGCLAKDIPVRFMYAARQIVYTATFEQCKFKAVTDKCALHHTRSRQPVPGNPISGSESDAEMGPMHFDTHRGCQSKRAQKVSHFLGQEPLCIFCPWVVFV